MYDIYVQNYSYRTQSKACIPAIRTQERTISLTFAIRRAITPHSGQVKVLFQGILPESKIYKKDLLEAADRSNL